MPVTRFTELRAWQLAHRLKLEIYEVVAVGPVVHDFRFCDDIKSSIASVCSNIAEGFGRYTHKEFAHFVVIARGSLVETQNHLIDAKDRNYLEPDKFAELWNLSVEAMASVTRLLQHLKNNPTPGDRRTTIKSVKGK